MDRLQKALLASLIAISAASWAASQYYQQEMMAAMMFPYSGLSVLLFTAVWTAGMVAMMFPSISPFVLLYNRLAASAGKVNSGGENEKGSGRSATKTVFFSRSGLHAFRITLFVGSYLAVWAVTGIALLLAWSLAMQAAATTAYGAIQQLAPVYYGVMLVAAGAYQFTSLKSKCLGYCESPMGFFMRRWKDGSAGAVRMGSYHGLYCLGCCWPYFLLMVALGWMDLLWMGLFASIIFGEKIWSRGIGVARIAGLGFIALGIASALGAVDVGGSTSGTGMQMEAMSSMDGQEEGGGEEASGEDMSMMAMTADQQEGAAAGNGGGRESMLPPPSSPDTNAAVEGKSPDGSSGSEEDEEKNDEKKDAAAMKDEQQMHGMDM